MTRIIGYLFVLFSVLSCSTESDKIIEQSVNNSWNKNDVKAMNFEIGDQKSPKDIIFVVNNNDDYGYSNLFLISEVKQGKNTIAIDTLNYILADPTGKWLGEGFGKEKQVRLLYKDKVTFPEKGSYSVNVRHGMRTTNLKGIEKIGIIIEDIE